MGTEKAEISRKHHHLLIAVDESENARRAVLYVADFLGGVAGFRATLLTVIPEPPPDYFKTEAERTAWIEDYRSKAGERTEEYRRVLVQAGFSGDAVDAAVETGTHPSIAESILDVQQRLRCSTIVVGRRGISKKEEFLFGSTSSKLLHSGKNCAMWVIE